MQHYLPAIIAGMVGGIIMIAFFSYAFQISETKEHPSLILLGYSFRNQSFVPTSVERYSCQPPATTLSGYDNSSYVLPLKDRVWISVRPSIPDFESKIVQGKCTLLNNSTLATQPEVLGAIQGSIKCIEGEQSCHNLLSYTYLYRYSVSVSKQEALSIANEFGITYNGTYRSEDGRIQEAFNPSTIVYENKLFKIYLDTTAKNGVGMQAHAKLIPKDRGYAMMTLMPGQSKNITLSFRTYTTFGGPATIDLGAWTAARDSGLHFDFSPSSIVIPEQSQANTTFIVKAPPDAREGVYTVRFNATVNNDTRNSDGGSLYCGVTTVFSNYDVCLNVRVGNNSDWQISDSGTGSLSGYCCSGDQPTLLSATITTDKEVYNQGDNVTISTYLTNNSNRTLVLPINSAPFVVNIFNQSSKNIENKVYGIEAYAFANSNQTITIQPHSKILFLRPFVWDQKTFYTLYPSIQGIHNVPAGTYYLRVEFGGFSDIPTYASAEKKIAIEPPASR